MSDFVNTIDLLGDDVVADSIINRTIEEFNDDQITSLPEQAFNGCSKLKAIRLPNLSGSLRDIIGTCASLEILELPKVTEIAAGVAVLSGEPVKELCLPSCKTIGGWSVRPQRLVKVDLPVCTYIGDSAFYSDYVLKYLQLL